MLVRGYAELGFVESAGLSFARAIERAHADPTVDHPAAWVIEDRRIVFSVEAEMGPIEIDAHRRLLEEMVREASTGEAYLDMPNGERWARRALMVASGVPRGHPMYVEGSGAAEAIEVTEMGMPTIRTGTGHT
jgi:hypothetical protein